MTTNIPFDQLLRAAAEQPQPQRLLFVFASAELPDDSTPAQRRRFEAGQGGALTPVICVDKAPAQLTRFDALLAESRKAGPPWQVVFAAGLSGSDGQPPGQPQIERALGTLVERVRSGRIDGLLALDATGQRVDFV